MRVITFRVGGSGIFFAPLAIFTAMLSHICCILPLLISMGIGSANHLLAGLVISLKPWLLLIATLFLGYSGWNTYHNPRAKTMEKAIFWISVVMVILLFIT